MRHRRENYPGDQNDSQAAVKSVQARKELTARRDRYIHGAHSAQEHRRVQERIDPTNALKNVVADHAGEQRNGDEYDRDDPTVGEPNDEPVPRNDGLSAMLELRKHTFHGRLISRFSGGALPFAEQHERITKWRARARRIGWLPSNTGLGAEDVSTCDRLDSFWLRLPFRFSRRVLR